MWEHQIETTTMNIDGITQDFFRHRRTFNVPTRPPRPPGTRPRRLTRLRTFPQSEVGRVPFATVGFRTSPNQQLLETAPAQLAIICVLCTIKIDIPFERIGKPFLNQGGNNILHLLDMLCRIREVVDPIHRHRFQVVEVILCHLFRQSVNRDPFLVGTVDQFVVHIGDIHHPGHLITGIRQVAFDGIENHGAHHVANMCGLIDGGAAQIHADLAGCNSLEIFLLT